MKSCKRWVVGLCYEISQTKKTEMMDWGVRSETETEEENGTPRLEDKTEQQTGYKVPIPFCHASKRRRSNVSSVFTFIWHGFKDLTPTIIKVKWCFQGNRYACKM